VIWRRVANRKTWVIVTSEPKDRIWTVESLMAGHEYVFRIMAQNKYGVGEPLDSEPEVARNRYSEFTGCIGFLPIRHIQDVFRER